LGAHGRTGRLRVKGYSWTGEQSVLEYTSAGTEEELIAAFEKTLDCPMLSGHIVH